MNPFPPMDAIPPEELDPALAAQARRARAILMIAAAAMVAVPVLLFVIFHA